MLIMFLIDITLTLIAGASSFLEYQFKVSVRYINVYEINISCINLIQYHRNK